jgi:8-oxo-dGTP diphosphatase
MSGWVLCEVHGRHWGVQGAAGLLPFTVTAGSVQVLLALRSHGTHQGGTWGTIGGAIEPGETPWEAAVREADEEAAGLDLAEAAEGHRYGCVSGWAYVTFPVRVRPASPVTIRSNWETSDLRWIPIEEVGSYPLHPALAESWPELRKLVEDQALLCIAQPVRTSEQKATLPGWMQMVDPALRSQRGVLPATNGAARGGVGQAG